MKNNTVVGEVIKLRLKERGITQLELAENIGTSSVYLNCILSGKRAGKKYLQKIFDTLELDVVEFTTYLNKIEIENCQD